MIEAFAALLICQLIGEIVVRGLALPFPGPVAGMGLLFCFLVWRGRRQKPEPAVPQALGHVADTLLRNLSLLFVPAAVGIVQHLGLLRLYALPILCAVVVSTVAALAVTAATFRLVARLGAKKLGDESQKAQPEDRKIEE